MLQNDVEVTIPSVLFESVNDLIKKTIDIASIEEATIDEYDAYKITLDTNYIENHNSITLLDCGDLSGSHVVWRKYETYILIKSEHGKSTELGSVMAYPYFRAGTLGYVVDEQNRSNEYPVNIHLTSEYGYNPIDSENMWLVDDTFTFKFLDVISTPKDNDYNSELKRSYDTVIRRMTEYANEFIFRLSEFAKIEGVAKKDYVKEGAGTAPNTYTGSTFNADLAGCEVKIKLKIKKEYICN